MLSLTMSFGKPVARNKKKNNEPYGMSWLSPIGTLWVKGFIDLWWNSNFSVC